MRDERWEERKRRKRGEISNLGCAEEVCKQFYVIKILKFEVCVLGYSKG